MFYAVRLTDDEVKAVAADVLGREMSDLALDRVEVRSGQDHDEMPSLFITAAIGPGIPALEGSVFARIHGALHEALLAQGEERFPYFHLRRADDEVPGDDLPAGGA